MWQSMIVPNSGETSANLVRLKIYNTKFLL
jgi:hypothetical protein